MLSNRGEGWSYDASWVGGRLGDAIHDFPALVHINCSVLSRDASPSPTFHPVFALDHPSSHALFHAQYFHFHCCEIRVISSW